MATELISMIDVSQFVPTKTEFACGFFTAAKFKYATPPGVKNKATVAQIAAWALDQYTQEYGSNGANMNGGVSISDMHRLLNAASCNCHDILSDTTRVKNALTYGYPLAVTVTEASVFDIDLQANPYFWGAAGTHVFPVTGFDASSNAFLVRDEANVVGSLQGNNTVRTGPRRYDASRIQFTWATMVIPSWLPELPANFDPTQPKQNNEVLHMFIKIISNPSPEMVSQANAIWNASPCGALNFHTGIAQIWQQTQYNAKGLGAPTSPEYPNKDWNGVPMVSQNFDGGRIDWQNGNPRIWVSGLGEMYIQR